MITWEKLDAGEYESEDGRFYIIKTYDRIYGNIGRYSLKKANKALKENRLC